MSHTASTNEIVEETTRQVDMQSAETTMLHGAGGSKETAAGHDDHAAAVRCCFSFPNPMQVRYVYALLLIIMAYCLFAWVVRESSQQRVSECGGDHSGCLAVEAVLVISLTSCLFFSFMFFSTVLTRKKHDCRNSWHCHWWLPKCALAMLVYFH